MNELSTMWSRLLELIDGPMHLRLFVQPAVASFLAIRAAFRDVRMGREPYFMEFLTNRFGREDLARAVRKDFNVVFITSLALDLIYQLFMMKRFLPLQAILVFAVLAMLPYMAVRRLAYHLRKSSS